MHGCDELGRQVRHYYTAQVYRRDEEGWEMRKYYMYRGTEESQRWQMSPKDAQVYCGDEKGQKVPCYVHHCREEGQRWQMPSHMFCRS
jgi:hypothetical protein